MKVVAGLVALAVLAGCGSNEARVDQVVDDLPEEDLERYCRSYAQERGTGFSEDEAFAAFQKGYTSDDPPAREVFEEIRGRCE